MKKTPLLSHDSELQEFSKKGFGRVKVLHEYVILGPQFAMKI